MDTTTIGHTGESVACEYLKRKGFKIVERNYRKPWGEIDIIATKGGTVRFVEVKAISCETLPSAADANTYRPEEQVHPAKLKKIARTAETYMAEKNDVRDYQIDVVGVFLEFKTKKARCRLFEGVI